MRRESAVSDNFVWQPQRTWEQIGSRFALRLVLPAIVGAAFVQLIALPAGLAVAKSLLAFLP